MSDDIPQRCPHDGVTCPHGCLSYCSRRTWKTAISNPYPGFPVFGITPVRGPPQAARAPAPSPSRLRTLAAFIRGQAGLTDKHPHKPGPGEVRLNNEEALLAAAALELAAHYETHALPPAPSVQGAELRTAILEGALTLEAYASRIKNEAAHDTYLRYAEILRNWLKGSR